jgi:hypothetical protein
VVTARLEGRGQSGEHALAVVFDRRRLAVNRLRRAQDLPAEGRPIAW